MKYLKQFLIILAVSFGGEILHAILPLPIAASVYGIILMFILLELKILKVDHVRETSNFLIEIMPIMFIPSAVGLIDSWGLLQENLAAYVVTTVVSTFLVMAVSGWVTQFVIRRGKKNSGKEAPHA